MSKSSLNNGNPNMVQFTGDNINASPHFEGIFNHPETSSFSAKMGNDMSMNISNPNGPQVGNVIHPLAGNLQNPNANFMNKPNINNNIFPQMNQNNLGKITTNAVPYSQMRGMQLNSNLLPNPIPILADKPNLPNIPNAASNKKNSKFFKYLAGALDYNNDHIFNINVHYKGQLPHPSNHLLDLNTLEKSVENINSLPEGEIANCK